MNTSNAKIMRKHSHIHGVVKLVNNDFQNVIKQDAKLARMPDTSRQDFARRMQATSLGDRKNRPSRMPERIEARIEDYERTEAAEALLKTATDAGVVVETETKLNRLDDQLIADIDAEAVWRDGEAHGRDNG